MANKFMKKYKANSPHLLALFARLLSCKFAFIQCKYKQLKYWHFALISIQHSRRKNSQNVGERATTIPVLQR